MRENDIVLTKRLKADDIPQKLLMIQTTKMMHFLQIHLLRLNLLHILEQAAISIGFYLNSDKIELTCFNQDGVISVNDKSLKPVDLIVYVSRKYTNWKWFHRIYGKAWTAIDRILTIWKSILLFYLDSNQTFGEKAGFELLRKQHPPKQQFYRHLTPILQTI